MRIICACCARQVIYGSTRSDTYVAPGCHPKASACPGMVFCDECGRDLDGNGMFPEERKDLSSVDDIQEPKD